MSQKRTLEDWEKAECAALKELVEAYNKAKPKPERITQEAAGAALGITQGAFSNYLNGRLALNKETAAGISRLFGIPVEKFSQRLADEIAEMAKAVEPDETLQMFEEQMFSIAAQATLSLLLKNFEGDPSGFQAELGLSMAEAESWIRSGVPANQKGRVARIISDYQFMQMAHEQEERAQKDAAAEPAEPTRPAQADPAAPDAGRLGGGGRIRKYQDVKYEKATPELRHAVDDLADRMLGMSEEQALKLKQAMDLLMPKDDRPKD